MKKIVLTALMLVGIIGSASAQHDDLYFVPKKKAKTETVAKEANESPVTKEESLPIREGQQAVSASPVKGLQMDEDAYNRRGAYLTEQGNAVSEFAMDDEGFVLITEEGDTMWMNTDTLKFTRVQDDEGWINGFDGSDSDYEYAMRIVRFRNPRYAIPVSSPLYWDVVYGGALWPTWDWNIYDDGMYAYVFPTSSNWLYWDYMMSYPFGWSPWGGHWNHHWGWHHGYHWGHHWGGFYGNIWYDPWYDPYYYGCYPGWHHGPHHGHHGFYPGLGVGKPGWGGVTPGRPRENERHATVASTRRGSQDNNGVGRNTTAATRRGTSVTRADNGSTRSSSVRVVTGRAGSSSNRSSGAVGSSSSRSGNDDVLRRGGNTSSSVSRGAATGSSSRSSYTRQSSSRSSSGSSYNRPSSTRSSSSSISRSSSSSSSRSGSSGSYSSGSTRSSSSSSYSSGSSYSSSSRSSSSYSGGGSSYGGGGSRGGSSSSGGSRGGGGSRR